MKSFNRTYLPESVTYKDETYRFYSVGLPSFIEFSEMLRTFKFIKIKVLAANLKGVKDFSGNSYKPQTYFFITEKSKQ